MKGSKDHKRYVSVLRSIFGKKNGVIPAFVFDDLHIFKLETCRKFRKTNRRPRDGYFEKDTSHD